MTDNRPWVRCPFEDIKYFHFLALVTRQNTAVSSATQQALAKSGEFFTLGFQVPSDYPIMCGIEQVAEIKNKFHFKNVLLLEIWRVPKKSQRLKKLEKLFYFNIFSANYYLIIFYYDISFMRQQACDLKSHYSR